MAIRLVLACHARISFYEAVEAWHLISKEKRKEREEKREKRERVAFFIIVMRLYTQLEPEWPLKGQL